MLRKEMKETAQRALRGKYGKWAVFVALPVTFYAILFMVMMLLFGVIGAASISDSYYDDDYYNYDYYEDDDYYSSYTPAYNYGYALGYQSGYEAGWPDGKEDTGTGETELEDEEIIEIINERPEEFLVSEDFEEGFIDAYSYSYYEAWNDAQAYQSNFLDLGTPIGEVPQPSALHMPVSNYYDDDYYAFDSDFRAVGIILLVSLALMLVGLVFAILYQMLYLPLLQWTAIDTIDGEEFTFGSSTKQIFSHLGVVAWTNFKIYIFTFLWSFLFIIPGVIKRASYSMTNYLLKREPELESTNAIALSEEMMRGYKMEYLIFQYSFFWWYLATAYSIGFAGFYVLPYYYTAEAVFFDQIYFEKRLHHQAPKSFDQEFNDLDEIF